MKKKMSAVVIALSVITLMAAFATSAQAHPTYAQSCTGCHSKSTNVKISAVQTANNGVTATYKVTVTGPNPILGWAVLSGSTNLAHASAGTGTFQVAVGKTYAVWGVSKTSGGMPSSNSLSISPVAPPTPPTPTPTGTPVPTTTPGPVTPGAKSTVIFHMHFEHASSTAFKLKNLSTGRYYTGVTMSGNRIVFRNIPNGTYTFTSRYRMGKVHTIGTYAIARGRAVKVVRRGSEID